jgi:hypothetical protein
MHKVTKNLGGSLKYHTPDICHEGSYTLRTHQYQGTAAQNSPPGDLPPMICAPLLLLKII